MQNLVIVSGGFTAAGNFSGYTTFEQRVHIYKRQMDAINIKAGEVISFPLYVMAESKKIGQLNEAGEPIIDAITKVPVTVDRLTATSVFLNEASIIEAHVQTASLDMKITAALNTAATTLGLTKEQLLSLANASL